MLGVTLVCSGTLLLLATVVGIFLPTTKEYAAIKVIPMVANDEDLHGIGLDAKNLAREWLEELCPEKAREGNHKGGASKKEKKSSHVRFFRTGQPSPRFPVPGP